VINIHFSLRDVFVALSLVYIVKLSDFMFTLEIQLGTNNVTVSLKDTLLLLISRESLYFLYPETSEESLGQGSSLAVIARQEVVLMICSLLSRHTCRLQHR
jgi:hypothetical protein